MENTFVYFLTLIGVTWPWKLCRFLILTYRTKLKWPSMRTDLNCSFAH